MAGRFTRIPQNTFDALQMDAGILLNKFDPANPTVEDADIICATTGGINPSCVPTYSDFFEDVDNAPNNMAEGKHLDGWDCKLSTTGLGTSPALIALALGAADIDELDETHVNPRTKVNLTDFKDVWWVGDKADGGFVAIHLKNGLSTGGFSLQTTKNGKGTIALEITGHPTIATQNEVPMEFYSVNGEEPVPPTPVTPSISLNTDEITLAVEATETLTATTVPEQTLVTWSTSDGNVATVEAGVVTGVAEGTATITASMVYENVEYTATCAVTVSTGA